MATRKAIVIKTKMVKETKNKVRYDDVDSPTTEGFYFRKTVMMNIFGRYPEILYMTVGDKEPLS
jgi:hypothetical protein